MKNPQMEWPCLAVHQEGVTLSIKASPNAYRTEAQGLWQQKLRVRIQAPPVEGKANEALVKWVGRIFGIRRGRIELIHGARGNKKTLLLRGLELGEAQGILTALLDAKSKE